MPAISAQNLTKQYRIQQKESGLVRDVKALFKPHHKEKVAVAGLMLSLITTVRATKLWGSNKS